MEPLDLLKTLRRGWIVIVFFGLLGALIALALSRSATPMYRATTTLFFSVSGVDSTAALFQGATFSQNQVQSYALLAKLPAVLQPVVDELDLDQSARQLSAQIATSIPADTVLLNVSVSSPSAESAAEIANSVGAELAKVVTNLSKSALSGDSGFAAEGTVVAEAEVPRFPYTPNTRKNVLLGLVLSLGLGAASVVVRDILNTKVRTEDDLHSVTDTPVIGVIPHESSNKSILVQRGPRAEAFRRLTSNLDFVDLGHKLRILVVTSAMPGEGKTTTAINLAIILAESQRVLLVDADLRDPSIAGILGVDDSIGLSTVLSGRSSSADAIQLLRRSGLSFMSAGELPPNPSQLLGSEPMKQLLSELERQFDIVVVDSPPVLLTSDSTILTQQADASIVVVNARRTKSGQLRGCLRDLSLSGSPLLGIVLNQASTTNSIGSYGGYGYVSYPLGGAQESVASNIGQIAEDHTIQTTPPLRPSGTNTPESQTAGGRIRGDRRP